MVAGRYAYTLVVSYFLFFIDLSLFFFFTDLPLFSLFILLLSHETWSINADTISPGLFGAIFHNSCCPLNSGYAYRADCLQIVANNTGVDVHLKRHHRPALETTEMLIVLTYTQRLDVLSFHLRYAAPEPHEPFNEAKRA